MSGPAIVGEDIQRTRDAISQLRLVGLAGVADITGLSLGRVKSLRRQREQVDASGAPYFPRRDALPRPLDIPGDPLYLPEEIRQWGRWTGRLKDDGTPQRIYPPGPARMTEEERQRAEERRRARAEATRIERETAQRDKTITRTVQAIVSAHATAIERIGQGSPRFGVERFVKAVDKAERVAAAYPGLFYRLPDADTLGTRLHTLVTTGDTDMLRMEITEITRAYQEFQPS